MNKTSLARELSAVLELSYRLPRASKADEVLRVILKAMKQALWRGESIYIRGFGIFKIRELPARKCHITHFHGKMRGRPSEIVDLPAKRKVHFQPSKIILRSLNS